MMRSLFLSSLLVGLGIGLLSQAFASPLMTVSCPTQIPASNVDGVFQSPAGFQWGTEDLGPPSGDSAPPLVIISNGEVGCFDFIKNSSGDYLQNYHEAEDLGGPVTPAGSGWTNEGQGNYSCLAGTRCLFVTR